MASVNDLRLLVGTYTATSGGHANGIVAVTGAEATTVAPLDDPSFLAVTADRLYAVSETTDGTVHAFRRGGLELEHLWEADAGGDAPCHIVVEASGALLVTNYTSGTVTTVAVEAAPDGAHATVTHVLPDVLGPNADRQEGPHAHQSLATPDGTVLVSDLGGDALHEFRVTAEPTLELVHVHHVTPGVGPRHMVWVGGDLLVAGELDGAVHRLRRDESGSFVEIAAAAAFDGDVGETLLSHIEAGPRGLVFVAVRGRDTIAVFDPADSGLVRVGETSCGGIWPRHFAFVDDLLLVANQLSDDIAVLRVGADGLPSEQVARIAVGSPTCIVPV